MKNKKITPMLAALALTVSVPTHALLAQETDPGVMQEKQETPMSQPSEPGADATAPVDPAAPDMQGGLKAEDLEGEAVYGKDGDKVAKVNKIVRQADDGTDHAVLTVGSILGFGGTDVRVPLERITVDGEGHLQVAMTEEELKQFPPNVPDEY